MIIPATWKMFEDATITATVDPFLLPHYSFDEVGFSVSTTNSTATPTTTPIATPALYLKN